MDPSYQVESSLTKRFYSTSETNKPSHELVRLFLYLYNCGSSKKKRVKLIISFKLAIISFKLAIIPSILI